MRRVLLIVLFAVLALPPAAHAWFPGANGKIAFSRAGDIWTANPDGSNLAPLTSTPDNEEDPRWSPDGAKIVYTTGGSLVSSDWVIRVMDANGANAHPVVTLPQSGYPPSPTWSPDGTQLLYLRLQGTPQIWKVDADGSNPVQLTTQTTIGGGFGAHDAAWSPDGNRILFRGSYEDIGGHINSGTFTIAPDGSGVTYVQGAFSVDEEDFDWAPNGDDFVFTYWDDFENLWVSIDYQLLASGLWPVWSPDGTKILYRGGGGLAVMNPDGSGNTTIVTGAAGPPSWQPILKAYPRPKGAGTIHAPLVPAYATCSSPNRIHSPPLSYNSCNPPSRLSTQLTIGTPDANGQAANSNSSLRIGVVPGNPATPADEAEANLKTSITDVRNASDLTDYTGSLEMRVPLQITDRSNTPYPGGPGPGTVQSFTFTWSVPCTATPDPAVGASCILNTTADALMPGSALETRRAIWETDRIEVRDGSGQPFLRQGIFIP